MFAIIFLMSNLILKRRNYSKLWPVYLAAVLFSFHFNSLVYVNSSYLARFFNQGTISLIYVLGSLGNIVLFFLAIHIENHYGNRKFFFLFLLVEFFAVLGLALASTSLAVAMFFVLFESSSLMILYSLDIFLEDATPKKETGVIRGTYLTLSNLALVLSPLLIAFVAPNGEFNKLYFLSVLFLLPLFILAVFSFSNFKDGTHKVVGLPIRLWFKTKNIRRVTQIRHTLDLFFSFMVIYMPIYLHTYIGFSWTQISFIFSIMLLPFILFEIPFGKMADEIFGEKEMMTLGLFIIGTALLIIPFLKIQSIPFWIALLFFSRIGASMVEITCESYFYKHVDKRDTGLISIYKLSWPTAFILGPIIGAFSLSLFPFEGIFLLLAIIVLFSMTTSSRLRDTL